MRRIKRKLTMVILIAIIVVYGCASVFAYSTTSFEFRLYNRPNAERAALEIAKTQDELWNPEEEDPMEMFRSMLISQIFARFAQNITASIFGDEELLTGEYEFENYRVTVLDTGTGIRVEVVDTLTGETTLIEVPYYNYSGTSF